MTKERAPEELIGAIKKVLAGGKYVSSTLAERLAFNLDQETEKAPHEMLFGSGIRGPVHDRNRGKTVER